MAEEPPFNRLMTDLRDGDPDAAREVFDRFARRLVKLAASRLPVVTRPKVDPEDVVQSVFATFFRRHRAGEFSPAHWDALWSLLVVIAVRKCGHRVDHLFAAKRDVRRERSPPGRTADGGLSWEPEDRSPSAEEIVLYEDAVHHFLAGLKEYERPIVELRLGGLTIAEVAEEAKASERRVNRILAVVRRRLELEAEER
jgi:RNA polymerase sigma-70 factor (ECF subfamily)